MPSGLKLFIDLDFMDFLCILILFFQKLTNMRIMKENMRTGNLPANMKKNRVLQIIPCEFQIFCTREDQKP